MSTTDPVAGRHPLAGFFDPRSVAVIGASTDPNKLGGKPIRYFRDAGFTGAVYPVNSRNAEIQGYPAYASVEDIPGPVDQAMIILPAAACLDALRACARKGIRFVQVLSSGFGEAGPEGRAAQDELVALAREHGIRLLGPNCLGLVSVRNRFFATFSTALEALVPLPGGLAVATQSGAFGSCTYAMAIQRGLGLSRIVATGNEADVDVAECIDYLADDPETRVICAALEGCGDGDRLRRALAHAAARAKPVILMKVGTSAVGVAAAATHTGSLAGDDAAFDAVFAEGGAWRARTIEEMLDIAQLCLTQPVPANDRATLITVSGGIGVLMADAAEAVGLDLPPVPAALADQLQAILPFAPVGNPFDTTAQVGSVHDGVVAVARTMLQAMDSATLLLYVAQMAAAPARFADTHASLLRLRAEFPDRALVLIGPSDEGLRRQLETEGFAFFTDPSRAVVAAGAAVGLVQRREQARALAAFGRAVPGEPAQAALAPVADTAQARGSSRPGSAPAGAHVLNEVQAKQLLRQAGLPVLPEHLCTDPAQAVAAAQAVGYPVVAKIVSADIAHKTEIGGVLLGLADAPAVQAAFATLQERAAAAAPGARVDGVLIAPMAGSGVETVLGVHRDPIFGPMVMFGLGGVTVELFKDVAFASAPLSPASADALIDRVRASALLRGWRGRPALDVAALRDALVRLSAFAVAHAEHLDGIDINPFLLQETGGWCLDAVVSWRAPA